MNVKVNHCRTTKVIKVGGSLFDWPGLPQALHEYAGQDATACVFVFGGGCFVDSVRVLENRWNLTTKETHWLAIDCLRLTARLGITILTDSHAANQIEDLRRRIDRQDDDSFVFEVSDWLRHVDQNSPGLIPESWGFTSDSIAALLASEIKADELVLLKSTSISESTELQNWVDSDLVDACFPGFVKKCRQLKTLSLENPLSGQRANLSTNDLVFPDRVI